MEELVVRGEDRAALDLALGVVVRLRAPHGVPDREVAVVRLEVRVSRSLVLKLSKSGSGIWAPNSLSLDHYGNLVSQKHTKRP